MFTVALCASGALCFGGYDLRSEILTHMYVPGTCCKNLPELAKKEGLTTLLDFVKAADLAGALSGKGKIIIILYKGGGGGSVAQAPGRLKYIY